MPVITPSVLSLIVRIPYHSTWLGHARDEPRKLWPMFWSDVEQKINVMVKTDNGTVFPLFGLGHIDLQKITIVQEPVYLDTTFDASTTSLMYEIGPTTQVALRFLSPITPHSTCRQSLPRSYLTVRAHADRDLSVHIEISSDFVSPKNDTGQCHFVQNMVTVNKTLHGNSTKRFTMDRVNQEVMADHDDEPKPGMVGPPSLCARYFIDEEYSVKTVFSHSSLL